jgi:hypothetical protein
MIKTINSGPGITVTGASTNWPSFYNNTAASGNTLIGQMRYNGGNQTTEVYDGACWMPLTPAYPMIELSSEVQTILNWAKIKMVEELRLKQLAESHPSLKDALDALQQAEEKVKIVAALVQT